MERKGLEECAQTYRAVFEKGDLDADRKTVEMRNVETIKAIVEAIARDDYDMVARAVTDDVRLDILAPPEVPFVRRAEGRSEFLEVVRRNFGMLREQRPVILSVVAQGETVVVMAREQGRYSGEDRSYDLHAAQEFQFREGKLARVFEICSRS